MKRETNALVGILVSVSALVGTLVQKLGLF